MEKKWLINGLFLIILLVLFTVFYPRREEPDPGTRSVRVTKVIDGDTFRVGKEKIRLIGINCPETDAGNDRGVEFMGVEAKEYSKKLLQNKMVRLEFDHDLQDKFGRTLAYVFLDDGTFVNGELIRLGYAHVFTFPPNTKHLDLFEKLEDEARDKRVGLWVEQ